MSFTGLTVAVSIFFLHVMADVVTLTVSDQTFLNSYSGDGRQRSRYAWNVQAHKQ